MVGSPFDIAVFYGIKFASTTGKERKRINGIFEKTEENQNGKPVFIKVGGGSQDCCWYTACDSWMVGDLEDKDANNAAGCAHSIEEGLATPDLVATWTVVKDGGGWEEQPAVTVTRISYTEVQATKEA